MALVWKVNYGVGNAFMLVSLQLLLVLHTIIFTQIMLPFSGTEYQWVSIRNLRNYFSFLHMLVHNFDSLILVWLLEMTVAFASLMATLIIERIDPKKGTHAIVPLIMIGIISNVYWRQDYFFFFIPSICTSSLLCIICIFIHRFFCIMSWV